MEFTLVPEIVQHELDKKSLPYKVHETLGTGSFGTVVRAHHSSTGERMAIKFIHTSKMHEYLCSEVRNHRQLRHPHVIRFKRAMEVGGHLGIVMEFADGGNLFQVVKNNKRLTEPLARWIFQQLMLAVDYCHRKGVASRDIKCENVLLVKGQKLPIVKLSDFGYSHSTVSNRPAKSVVGSVDYMAPEVLNNYDESRYDPCKADIWSCGVVLYVMLTGHYPFSRKHLQRRYLKDRDAVKKKVADLNYKLPVNLSDDVKHLLKHILTDVDHRISVDDIMHHVWFQKHYPREAATMNAELLEEERKRSNRPVDWQTDEEVEYEIRRASTVERMKRPLELVTDRFIDAEIDEDMKRHPHEI